MGKKAKRDSKKKNANSKQREAAENGNKPFYKNRKIISTIGSLVVLAIGFFGFNQICPKVVIEPAPAVDGGFLSSQFTFANQPFYPVKIISVVVWPIDFKLQRDILQQSVYFSSNVALGISYTHQNVQIAGGDSVSINIDKAFSFPDAKVKEGSKIFIEITYRLPSIPIDLTDSAMFQATKDIGGNQIWTKRPTTHRIDHKNASIFIYTNINALD